MPRKVCCVLRQARHKKSLPSWEGFFLYSKQNGNCSSFTQFTFYGDLAAMILHGVLHDGQAEACAAGLVVLDGIVAEIVNDFVQQSANAIDYAIIAAHFLLPVIWSNSSYLCFKVRI